MILCRKTIANDSPIDHQVHSLVRDINNIQLKGTNSGTFIHRKNSTTTNSTTTNKSTSSKATKSQLEAFKRIQTESSRRNSHSIQNTILPYHHITTSTSPNTTTTNNNNAITQQLSISSIPNYSGNNNHTIHNNNNNNNNSSVMIGNKRIMNYAKGYEQF